MGKFQEKKIKIYADLISFDWFSFNQIYTPLLKHESVSLYNSFFYQKQVLNFLNIDSYSLNVFLKNLKIENKTFESSMSELESLNLVKISIKSNFDSSIEYLIKLKSPLSIKEAFRDNNLKNRLKKNLTEEKFNELILLTEENDFDYEVDLNKFDLKERKKESENIISKEIYCDFYNEIFKVLGCEFSINQNILELIKIYHCDEKKISLKKLKYFGYMSIKKNNEKYYISDENFNFLINKELNKSKQNFNSNKYDEFWKELLNMPENQIRKCFNDLFSEYESIEFYKKLSNKDKIPISLSKWIKNCVQNKNFSFCMVNATISFVKTLLKKLPINYLIKISDTLSSEGNLTFEFFIEHIKNVIRNDISNKNRLNILSDAFEKNFHENEISLNFVSHFLNN